jgi:hypothetical protein
MRTLVFRADRWIVLERLAAHGAKAVLDLAVASMPIDVTECAWPRTGTFDVKIQNTATTKLAAARANVPVVAKATSHTVNIAIGRLFMILTIIDIRLMITSIITILSTTIVITIITTHLLLHSASLVALCCANSVVSTALFQHHCVRRRTHRQSRRRRRSGRRSGIWVWVGVLAAVA